MNPTKRHLRKNFTTNKIYGRENSFTQKVSFL